MQALFNSLANVMKMPDRVAFTVFGRDIMWYAILITSGIIVAVIITSILAHKKKMPQDTAIDLCLWAVPLGLICARLYYVAFYDLAYYLANPIEIVMIWNGGLAIPGGIIGGALGVFIYSRIKKRRFLQYADVIVPGLAIAQAIGRWGNFFNQEAFGTAVTEAVARQWGFPFIVPINEAGAISYHLATFFYESVWCVLIFAALLILRKKLRHDGDSFILYAMLYSFGRTGIEYLRTDALDIGNVKVTMVLCAAIFVAALLFMIIRAIVEKAIGRIILPRPEVVNDEELDDEAEPALTVGEDAEALEEAEEEAEAEEAIDEVEESVEEAEDEEAVEEADGETERSTVIEPAEIIEAAATEEYKKARSSLIDEIEAFDEEMGTLKSEYKATEISPRRKNRKNRK